MRKIKKALLYLFAIFNKNEIYSVVNSQGTRYFLNVKAVQLRGGKWQDIYYFSRDFRKQTAAALPSGMKVIENPRNGFLTVIREGQQL